MHHIFFLTTGFQYFFAKQIIAQKNIQNPVFITDFHFFAQENQSPKYSKSRFHFREHALVDAIKKQNPQVFDISSAYSPSTTTRKNGVEKMVAEIISEIQKTHSRRSKVVFYSSYYDYLRAPSALVRNIRGVFKNPSFNLMADGVNLLRPVPWFGRTDRKYLPFLWARICVKFKIPHPNPFWRHYSGSYNRIIEKIYHFPMADDVPIYAPREKIEWIEIKPPKTKKQTDKILFIGAVTPVNRAFSWIRKNYPSRKIIYRPHPKEGIRQAENPDFEILGDLDIPLEEYIFEKNFTRIIGCSFSTTLIIAHLFCPQTEAVFLSDKKILKNKAWQPAAEAMGLKIIAV